MGKCDRIFPETDGAVKSCETKSCRHHCQSYLGYEADMKMKKRKMKLKAYYVEPFKDSEGGEVVVAMNCKEAKQLAWSQSDFIQEQATDDEGWIGVRVKWLKGFYIKGLKHAQLLNPDAETLRRGGFGWVEEAVCPICKTEDRLERYEYTNEKNAVDKSQPFRFVSCGECADKYDDGKLKPTDIPEYARPYEDLEKQQR